MVFKKLSLGCTSLWTRNAHVAKAHPVPRLEPMGLQFHENVPPLWRAIRLLLRLQDSRSVTLVAPYCAIPRDYLSDTALLRAMGFLVSQHCQRGAIPRPPFLRVPPWRACEVELRYPLPKGYLSDICATPHENKANGCDTPFCDTISRRYCAIWGGISHWAAKSATIPCTHFEIPSDEFLWPRKAELDTVS